MESIWENTVELPEFERLEGNVKTDVLIVGGGLAGILTAWCLKQAGVNCLLAEGKRIGSGITRNTTAKLTSQHGLIYDKLLTNLGREKAEQYLFVNERALGVYRELAKEIPCDFEEKDAFLYTLSKREKIEREVRAVQELGFPAEFSETPKLPFQTEGAIRFPNQAQFHPLKFLKGIAKDLPIKEQTFIRAIQDKKAIYDRGEIQADKIIVTSHFPLKNSRGSYFLKLYQHRSYVLALENVPQIDGMYLDENEKGFSFRNYGQYLFLGGGSHRTGKQGGAFEELRAFKRQYYPDAREAGHWAAQDCMSLDGIPYIGHYSKHTPNLYVASGFQKWGMTTSMAGASLLCDLVLGKNPPEKELFSPSRNMIKPQLFKNGLESFGNLLFPSFRRCSHMGCRLKWNPAEHSWDCPCHGSRFQETGAVIDNPAMRESASVAKRFRAQKQMLTINKK